MNRGLRGHYKSFMPNVRFRLHSRRLAGISYFWGSEPPLTAGNGRSARLAGFPGVQGNKESQAVPSLRGV